MGICIFFSVFSKVLVWLLGMFIGLGFLYLAS